MKLPETVKSFFPALKDLETMLGSLDDSSMVIGGLASCLLGKPRLTADIDAVLAMNRTSIRQLITAAHDCGFSSRMSDAEDYARTHHVVLLRHDSTGVDVDLALGYLPFEIDAVARGEIHQLGNVSVRLPVPEDLIIMKAVANRPKDWEDIRAVLARHPNVDRERITQCVAEFAHLMELPDLPDMLASVLSKPQG